MYKQIMVQTYKKINQLSLFLKKIMDKFLIFFRVSVFFLTSQRGLCMHKQSPKPLTKILVKVFTEKNFIII